MQRQPRLPVDKMKKITVLLLLVCVATVLRSQAEFIGTKWTAADPAAVAHWQSLRFGMFIHWGPVSLTGHEIGWSRGRETPVATYDNLYKEFDPTRFNADAWVALARAAGMKYIVLVTKHHDGFCLWNTKLTDYNIMNSPFHRDVVKELASACKKQGIEFGAYYSVMDNYNTNYPSPVAGQNDLKREHYDLDAYENYLQGQISELIQNYGPLLTIWNDVPRAYGPSRGAATINLVRQLQPDILINNRTGDGGDYDTPEQRIGTFQEDRPWESCMTVSAHNHWAWGGTDDGVKPIAECVRMLVQCAGGDGNMSLNVGPRPDGVIDPEQANLLKKIGAWLAINGEGIYGTRGGPWKPTRQIASTRKGHSVYVFILNQELTTVELPVLPRNIISASLLGGAAVRFETVDGKIILHLSPHQAAMATVVKLDLNGSAMDIPAISLPATFSPPMGWNSWDFFGKKHINEQIVREVIDAMATNGLRAAGYNYVVVDGGWRDNHLAANGGLLANPVKFPHGMKALADYAHLRGFKFGLHTVPGNFDCGCDPVGGYGHEAVQIAQFVSWGLDFIKLDKCRFSQTAADDYHQTNNGWNDDLLKATYAKWHEILAHCGRPVVFSMSAYKYYDWYPQFGQMGRTTGDIRPKVYGGAVFDGGPGSVMFIADENNRSAGFAGRGYWNDPDMLVTGKQGLNQNEQQSHFALWCVMSAPLMLGDDPRNLTDAEKSIVLNAEAIAIDQDPTEQGRRISKDGDAEVWVKHLAGHRLAVLLLNRGKTETMNVTTDWKTLNLTGATQVRDVFSHSNLGLKNDAISLPCPPHGSRLLLLKPAASTN